MKNPFSEFQGTRILITGGAGCIGSNLVRRLLKLDPAEVTLIDDLSAAPAWNVPQDPRVSFIEGSVLDDGKMTAAFTHSPEYVFHLAAHFANQNSVDHPETDLMVNGMGVLKALKLSEVSRVKRFVFASSGCSVYGSRAPVPVKEEFISLHLDTPYQITKLLGELYCNYFHDYYGLPVVIGRFFNVYGPGEVPGKYRNVIPNFSYWALHGRPLPIMGTGEETRDWTFVDDIVNGLLLCALSPSAVGNVFNIASGTETRVKDVAETINRITGNKAGITHLPRRDWDKIERRRASIEKASLILGYRPKVTIQDGIARTVEWMKTNLPRIEHTAEFKNFELLGASGLQNAEGTYVSPVNC